MQFIKKLLLKIINKIFRRNNILWVGPLIKWPEDGYDNDLIIEKVRIATKNVKDGIFPYERDSVNFDKAEYQESFVFAIKEAIKKFGNKITILDFGGALGSHYYCYSNYPEFKDIDFTWVVVEQAKFVEIGKQDFTNDNLKFADNIEDAFKRYGKIHLAIFSSVLMYIKDYNKIIISELLKIKPDCLLIARTFIDTNLDNQIITIQKVPKEIYKADYPCYIFSSNFEKLITDNGYLKKFDAPSLVDGSFQNYKFKKELRKFTVRDIFFECSQPQ